MHQHDPHDCCNVIDALPIPFLSPPPRLHLCLQKKSKRKKKKRLPKGFDASKPDGGLPAPDPERWLPKWERSEFKKRKARRNKDAVKGSQGAGKVDENLDRTKVGGQGAGGWSLLSVWRVEHCSAAQRTRLQ
jgi:hypothetical protein